MVSYFDEIDVIVSFSFINVLFCLLLVDFWWPGLSFCFTPRCFLFNFLTVLKIKTKRHFHLSSFFFNLSVVFSSLYI